MSILPGEDTSFWLATTPTTKYPKYKPTSEVADVVVVGGGIAGILTAWYLQQAGMRVVIIEKNRIIENTTGNTTAKLTSQHNLIYDFLINKHGDEAARAFGQANQQAVRDIKQLSEELEIDCDYEMADAYVYTKLDDKAAEIQREVEAAKSLGLPASFEEKIELPIEIKAAIKFADQAQFHPRKFLLGVAEKLVQKGAKIYEQTEAKDIIPGKITTLKTAGGDVKGKFIVGATKYPFWKTEIFEDAIWTKLSYALGVKLKNGYPKNMYISAEHPVRTIRSHPYEDSRLLVFGGESHEMTKDYDKNEHYKNLIEDVVKLFNVERILYRWIAGDVMPNDRMPYIGTYPNQANIFIVTGFHAWGLAWGMAAAQIVRDEITGKSNPYSEFFSLKRLNS